MAHIFGFEVPDQCRNCEFLCMNVAAASERRDALPSDYLMDFGVAVVTAAELSDRLQTLISIAGKLCSGTELPDEPGLEPCRLDKKTNRRQSS